MDIIDFFNSEELELPGSWDSFNSSFEEYIKKRFDIYLDLLNKIYSNNYKFLSKAIINAISNAENLCNSLKKCLNIYLSGHPSEAYTILDQGLSEQSCFQAMYTFNDVSPHLNYLYRIRKSPSKALERKELFHVPFQLRHQVATFRYSIPGLPCLYCGSSAYVCWEECGRPDVNDIHLSRLCANSSTNIQLLDFGWRPAEIAAMINSRNYVCQLSVSSELLNFVVAQAICWPILAACSIKVRHTDGNFKPEYIIPQLVLQWVSNQTKIIGVRYFSTKVSDYDLSKRASENFAFPVRTTKANGYCERLCEIFTISNPVNWQTVGPTAPTKAQIHHCDFKINGTEKYYSETELGRLQGCADQLVLCNI